MENFIISYTTITNEKQVLTREWWRVYSYGYETYLTLMWQQTEIIQRILVETIKDWIRVFLQSHILRKTIVLLTTIMYIAFLRKL